MSRPNRRQTLGLGLGVGLALGAGGGAEAAPASPHEPTFTLLLVNDLYQMSEVDGRGGFARLAAIVRAERARGVPMLYAHAGDTLSPSLMSGFDRGAHIVELLNIAPPDVFVPGNHEFDFGPATFLKRMDEAAFPVLAANLRDAGDRLLPGLRDRMVVTLGDIRVGVVGIALASTPEKSQAGDLRFGPEIEALSREVQALRAEGVDLVVGSATPTGPPTTPSWPRASWTSCSRATTTTSCCATTARPSWSSRATTPITSRPSTSARTSWAPARRAA